MIYFVRHGETDWNASGIRQGWTGNSLNARGREQAEKITAEIVKLKPQYFYSSDLMRAKETAEVINKKLGMPIIYDRRLREFCHGIMAGTNKNDENETTKDFFKNPHKYEAETKQDSFHRAKDFIKNEIIAKNIDNAVIISHGGIMRMFKYCEAYKEFDLDKYTKFAETFKIKNTDILEIDFTKLKQFMD